MPPAATHHPRDQHDAPLDPELPGAGRVFTDAEGRYRFVTIKPGAYPWRNHHNAWRPDHIHFSLFGAGFAQRLVTQMYFPGDPLLALDPIFHARAGRRGARPAGRRFDLEITEPEWALGYRFDIVLRGRGATPDGGTEPMPRRHRQPDHRSLLAPDRAQGMGRPDALRRAGGDASC